MKNFRLHSCVSAVALAASTMFVSPVYAQDAAAAEEETVEGLDEIVVTASGRDQTKLETSVSVSSVSADLISFQTKQRGGSLERFPASTSNRAGRRHSPP